MTALASRQSSQTHRADHRRPSARPAVHDALRLPPVSRLQRALGNRGMRRLLRPGTIQAKLTVGPVDDEYERQADRVAEQVVGMPKSAAGPAPTPAPMAISRKCPKCQEDEPFEPSAALASYINTSRGSGQPLPPSARDHFESRFGHDFGAVRVHHDQRSAQAAAEINALAFTVGTDIHFGAQQLQSGTPHGDHLLAHELTHTIQQTGGLPLAPHGAARPAAEAGSRRTEYARSTPHAIQRAGDPAAIPPGLRCPTDLTPGRPAGTDIVFASGAAAITAAHRAQLTAFRATWLAAGGTDDILVHGYASPAGAQAANWTLSCDRAEAVQAELVRLGIPAVRVSVVAHGESTDFGSGNSPNQHAVVSSSASILPLPLVTGTLTPADNFTGRSTTRFGVGEVINLGFASLPPRPAADFGGLEWHLVAGAGTLTGVNTAGTGTYTAPATASAVRLELRVAGGATAGRVVSTHAMAIVIPSAVRMTVVAGTAPTFAGVIAAGTWGAGFHANVFVDPRDVSFQGVVFGEGTVAGVVSGSFLSGLAGRVHPVNTFGAAHGGNATTGTPVSPPPDGIATFGVAPRRVGAIDICGASDFIWAIPWEFSVAGGPRTAFAGGFTANHHVTSTLLCNATIEKAGAGPFCRRINGTTC